MTGDWAGFVQILILSLVELNVCDVPVVVLNNINLIVKIVDDVDISHQTLLSEVVTGEPVQHHVA